MVRHTARHVMRCHLTQDTRAQNILDDVASSTCVLRVWRATCGRTASSTARGWRQGLTLVHFSAQPKPFRSHLPVSPCLIDWGKSCAQRIPQNVLTLSRIVDKCRPQGGGGGGGRGVERIQRGVLGAAPVRRCSLTPSNPRWKRLELSPYTKK
jgi:hypothetical protein